MLKASSQAAAGSARVRSADPSPRSTTSRILVADDDPTSLELLSAALRAQGWTATGVDRGEATLRTAAREPFDLIILDLVLPDLSGTEVCRRLRSQSPIPIIMLSPRDTEVDLVLALELGADDYVARPFSMPELLSRVRATLRRRELDRCERSVGAREVAGVRLDFARHEVVVDGRGTCLTPSEFKLLALLMGDPGRVFTRAEIMEELWQSAHVGDRHACDVHISNLRRKIELDPRNPRRLATVRGVGYRFAAPDEQLVGVTSAYRSNVLPLR